MLKRIWLWSAVGAVWCGLLAGCGAGGGGLTAATSPLAASVGVSGVVHGGQQPVSGASIGVWAVNTNGTAATSILNNGVTVTSNSTGGFTLTGLYTCPSTTAQVYVTAQGGNPGLGSNNGALALMTAVGPCGSMLTTPFITVNEVTTVAAVWALQQFIGVVNGTAFAETIGVTGTAQSAVGMVNAFSTAQNLANLATGAAGPVASVTNATDEVAKIDTIANILSSCVNSGGGSPCTTLFQTVSPTGMAVASDTIQAALYMAQNPVANVSSLYGLASASAVFQPALSTAPYDWTLGIFYTGSGLNTPYELAVDATGNIWILNAASGSATGLVELTPNGQAVSGSPFLTGTNTPLSLPQTVAVDTLGNVWTAQEGAAANDLVRYVPSSNTYTTLAAVSGCSPEALAIDGSNDVFFTCSGLANAYEYANVGTVSVPAYNTSPTALGAVGSSPNGIALDTKGDVWVGNTSSSTVTELPAAALTSPVTYSGNYTTPYGVTVDHSGDIWVSDGTSDVTEMLLSGSSYSPTSFPGAGINSPRYMAVDGAGYIWVANSAATTLNSSTYVSMSKLTNTGAPISLDATSAQPGGFAKATTATSPAPRGIAIDPSGNVWMTGCSTPANCSGGTSFVLELVGAAAPVVTPLAAAQGSNSLGCCGNTAPAPGSVTINPAGSASLGAANYAPTQNSGSFAFAVYRESGSTGAASVQYSTSSGTAIAGTDYTAQTGTVSWANGDQSVQTITVPWLETSNYSGTKTFTVTLSNPTGGVTLGSYPTTLVSVTDNLTPPYPAFNFSQTGSGCFCTWKIQLPVDEYGGNGGVNGSQFGDVEVLSSALDSGFSDPYFYLNSSNYIVFTTPANGATTSPGSGSNHTRSELRELYSGTGANSSNDWFNTTGGTMNATVNVTEYAPATDEVTIGQIHGDPATFAVLQWRVTGNVTLQLYSSPTGSSANTTLLSPVSLNDTISYAMQVSGTTLTVTVHDLTTSTSSTNNFSISSWAGYPMYFKVGAYHDTTNTGNGATDASQVVVRSFSVTHP